MASTTSAQQLLHATNADARMESLPPQFWTLIETYRSDLVNQAYAILGDMADAEDAAQETFCEALRKPEELGTVESVGAWLRALNKRNALDRLRDKRRHAARAARKASDPRARQLTTGGFSMLEVGESVSKAIEDLPEELRRVVVLHYWDHLSHDRIAARLQLSPRSVSRHLHDACLLLHASLKTYLEAPANPPADGAAS
ncbi:MAG: sigma-70 family RNA polymerase sigma factor [Planctomycetota bacterium]|nr:sigma-70 family RNA polymerase sigma factor [Planctomycetota bacterium]